MGKIPVTTKAVANYDPRLDPERKVLDRKHKLLKYMMGTKGCTRMGEQYICTCYCNSFCVTSHEDVVKDFQDSHEKCKNDT
jgi:hypothetical protein